MSAALPEIRPSQMPKLRAELLRSNRAIQESLLATAAAGNRSEMIAGLAFSARALAQREDFVELYLVSAQMTPVAVDAARDVPEQIIAARRPCSTGLLAFSGGLPPTPHPADPTVTARPEVITWTQDAEEAFVILWCRTSQLPAHAVGANPPTWARVGSCQVPLHEPYDWADYTPGTVNLLSLLLSTWMLMDIPTVVEARQSTVAGPRGKGGKRGLPRVVKTVDLRRLARKPLPEDTEAGENTKRSYAHQWVVRGHWRNQPVGPAHQDRRTTWVPSYLKGPADAPFLPSETVFVWRR